MQQPTAYFNCNDGARLGFGGAPIGNLFRAMNEYEVQSVLNRAWDDGCRSFDTAPHYGHGLSEKRLGDFLKTKYRSSFKISSKVGRLLTPASHVPSEQFSYVDGLPFVQHWDFSRAGIRKSIEDSLMRMGLSQLDTVYLHDIDQATHGENYPSIFQQLISESLPELKKLKQEGLLTHIGLGVNDHQVVLEVLKQADIDALMLAGRYTLLDTRALQQLMPTLIERNVALALGGVYNSGILAKRLKPDSNVTFNYAPASTEWRQKALKIQDVADVYNVNLRSAALQFALAHPATHLVMLGVRSEIEWTESRTSEKESIPSEFWQALKNAQLLPDEAPTP
jgi:D-threo-aldose 1-dehydrogenase